MTVWINLDDIIIEVPNKGIWIKTLLPILRQVWICYIQDNHKRYKLENFINKHLWVVGSRYWEKLDYIPSEFCIRAKKKDITYLHEL